MMNRFKVISLSVFLAMFLCLIWVWGCTKQEKVLSDFELYNKGIDAFEGEKYLEARNYFQEIEDLYPNSQYLSFARVGVAIPIMKKASMMRQFWLIKRFLNFIPWENYQNGLNTGLG